ncbi:hypothetical protein BLOT_002505 [Blomia tropicalis]|nr:hypothetical protein BLOT_002505 [Blomia tropicalis]
MKLPRLNHKNLERHIDISHHTFLSFIFGLSKRRKRRRFAQDLRLLALEIFFQIVHYYPETFVQLKFLYRLFVKQ